jgi:hypothetical protein
MPRKPPRILNLEPLEDRTVLATCNVTRLGDIGAGAVLGDVGRGDLRFCITRANANPGFDLIRFNSAVIGTINLTGPLPDITDDIKIDGPGPSLLAVRRDTGGDYRIFTIAAGVNAEIFNVAIRNGYAAGAGGGGVYNAGTLALIGGTVDHNFADANGGGIYNVGTLSIFQQATVGNIAKGANSYGGGIYNLGRLTVFDSVTAINVSEGGRGGGIWNSGELNVAVSNVSSNQAIGPKTLGGGIYNEVGGIVNITNVGLSYNTAEGGADGWGGGIYDAGGTLDLLNARVTENRAGGTVPDLANASGSAFGGGIFKAGGGLFIERSTIAKNIAYVQDTGAGTTSVAFGGGIYLDGSGTILNSTIAENVVTSDGDFATGEGGGIYHRGGTLAIDHGTTAENSVSANGPMNGGGIMAAGALGSTLEMANSIIAGNGLDGDCSTHSCAGPDLNGTLSTSDHNLIANSSGGSGYAPSDILDENPLLGPLADNGGKCATMALLPGSPAIDAGNNVAAPEWDQRGPGYPRIVGGTIDIGAFEVQATGAPGTLVSPDSAEWAAVPIAGQFSPSFHRGSNSPVAHVLQKSLQRETSVDKDATPVTVRKAEHSAFAFRSGAWELAARELGHELIPFEVVIAPSTRVIGKV